MNTNTFFIQWKYALAGLLLAMLTGKSIYGQQPAPGLTADEKAEWIRSHPEDYARLAGISTEPSRESLNEALNAEPRGTRYVDVAGFPEMPRTGNAQNDRDAYTRAKAAWIAAYPNAYAGMNDAEAPAPLSREARIRMNDPALFPETDERK